MSQSSPSAAAQDAVTRVYHAYFTGLLLALSLRRGAHDAAEWTRRVFRHQHEEKFLAAFDKLGLRGLPDAVACAGYHYLSNRIGGVPVEFMRESDRKAWVRFVPPRWVYPGAAICGIPSDVSRAMLRGWYAQNGVTLGNPRLGFVCTALTTDGQHGLAGYFLEHDHDLADDARLLFRPGELPPPFDAGAAPALDPALWTPTRLASARRNYAMEYIRSSLPRLAEQFGPAETVALGGLAARQIGAQFYRETAELVGVCGDDARAFAGWLVAMAAGEGDTAEVGTDGDAVIVLRRGWRLMRGLDALPDAVFEAWNGLNDGALAVHNRFLALDVLERPEGGSERIVWRVRPRRRTS